MHVLDSVGAAQTIKTRFVTAVSEIARNALVHASGGVMEFGFSQLKGTRSIVARCRDHGPGIPDIEQALVDGYTTAGSMGLGLGGSKRLVDRITIESTPGNGTTVTLEQRLR